MKIDYDNELNYRDFIDDKDYNFRISFSILKRYFKEKYNIDNDIQISKLVDKLVHEGRMYWSTNSNRCNDYSGLYFNTNWNKLIVKSTNTINYLGSLVEQIVYEYRNFNIYSLLGFYYIRHKEYCTKLDDNEYNTLAKCKFVIDRYYRGISNEKTN